MAELQNCVTTFSEIFNVGF